MHSIPPITQIPAVRHPHPPDPCKYLTPTSSPSSSSTHHTLANRNQAQAVGYLPKTILGQRCLQPHSTEAETEAHGPRLFHQPAALPITSLQRSSPLGCKLYPLVPFKPSYMDFPGGTVGRILCFHCQRPSFNPWSGTKSPQAVQHSTPSPPQPRKKTSWKDLCPPGSLSRWTPHSMGCPCSTHLPGPRLNLRPTDDRDPSAT